MKLVFCIFSSLAVVCSAQTLKPEQEPGDVPESLIDPEPAKEEAKPAPVVPAKELEPEMADEPDQGMQPTADEGIQIQVEKAAKVAGANPNAGQVKVYSPWPSKPLFPAPEGWQFKPAPKGVLPYRTTVNLGSGQEVNLAITPYVLTPVANGFTSISVMEPGYEAKLGYGQQNTVGAMLRKSTADIERSERQAAESIQRLQQLLTSLPRPVETQNPSPGDNVNPGAPGHDQ